VSMDAVESKDRAAERPVILPAPTARISDLAIRVLDLLGACILLAILSPLLLVVAVAIKLDSRGPVIFWQRRVGRDLVPFRVAKFRTMDNGAPSDTHRAYVERMIREKEPDDGTRKPMLKLEKDPRITRVGSFLRRTSLDELPQLLNVLRGEMSLVGPRPLILEESRHAAQTWHARRLDLRPGITGLWQISGRSDLPFQEMVRFDYQYVSGWSLARDVEILLATIPVVLSRRGAY
jgi:lipopolysaccharide/colanic/teichoic acid biosynthesis glycosyltransferase